MTKGTGCAARPLLPARKVPSAVGRQVAQLKGVRDPLGAGLAGDQVGQREDVFVPVRRIPGRRQS
jgi:hypothetical protein